MLKKIKKVNNKDIKREYKNIYNKFYSLFN